MRFFGERVYVLFMNMVWDVVRGWIVGFLRQRVVDFYFFFVEKIEIVKYFFEKFEWFLIFSWVKLWGFFRLGFIGIVNRLIIIFYRQGIQ